MDRERERFCVFEKESEIERERREEVNSQTKYELYLSILTL